MENRWKAMKPCPFCNALASEYHITVTSAHNLQNETMGHCAECDECSGFGPMKPTQAEAIAAWDDRPAEAELTEILQAIVSATRVGLAGKPVTRSKWGNYPAGLYHRARTVLEKAAQL